MRRWLGAALAALVAAGCSGGDEARFGRLRVTDATQSTWRRATVPASRGPAVGVQAVAFLDERHGFLVSGAGIGAEGRLAPGFGRIQETRDGGVTWRTRWSERGTHLHAVAFADPLHGIVAGSRHGGHPLLLRTSDGGRSWASLLPRIPSPARETWPAVVLALPSPRVAYAIGDQHFHAHDIRWMLRTTDGGRTWRELPGPPEVRGAYALDFLDEENGFAVGAVAGCAAGLWRTRDRGETWSPLRASCGDAGSVDFLDERTGFIAGGNPYYLEEPPWQVVRRTTDGGRSWRTFFVDSRRRGRVTNPMVELRFTSRLIGFGATGGCKGGQNAPCGGQVLATHDGGRHWRETGIGAMDVAAVGASAWAVPACMDCGVIWRTSDAGRTWTPLAGPDGVQLTRVTTSGARLLLATDAGRFSSGDDWRTWRREPRGARHPLRVDLSRAPVDSWVRTFVDRRHGYVAGDPVYTGGLYATDDGGRTWRGLSPPFRVDTISATRRLVVVAQWHAKGPGLLAFSADRGRTWLVRTPPREAICNATPAADRTVWLVCDEGVERIRRILLRSDDAGRTWTKLGEIPFQVERVVGASDDAWAVGDGLWHSTDGGRTWRQRWPRLPTPG